MGGGAARADQTIWFDDAGDAPHISLVGDSTLTGVRWYADYGALERYNFVFNAESCRRTIEQSCISREGYRSENVLATVRDLDGELGEVLVVMSGYNDPEVTIDDAVEAVVDEARDQGVGHVVWLTLRTGDDVAYSDPQQQSSVDTFRTYNEELIDAASSSSGYLQVADWDAFSRGADDWFEYDGVHLTPAGVDHLTDYLATTVDRVLAGQDVTPATPLWTDLWPGAEGDDVVAVQDALIAAGIDLAGGADGEYGDGTMIGVADYQRAHGLAVTGYVDLATARSLGVVDDPAAATTTTAVPASTTSLVPTSTITTAQVVGSAEVGTSWWAPTALVALVLAASAAAVLARRRHVVRARRARRWARVHPATSPGRSVADLRRSGGLPAVSARSRQAIYDHEVEPDEPELPARSV